MAGRRARRDFGHRYAELERRFHALAIRLVWGETGPFQMDPNGTVLTDPAVQGIVFDSHGGGFDILSHGAGFTYASDGGGMLFDTGGGGIEWDTGGGGWQFHGGAVAFDLYPDDDDLYGSFVINTDDEGNGFTAEGDAADFTFWAERSDDNGVFRVFADWLEFGGGDGLMDMDGDFEIATDNLTLYASDTISLTADTIELNSGGATTHFTGAIDFSGATLSGITVADLDFDPATQAELNDHKDDYGLGFHIPATGLTVAMMTSGAAADGYVPTADGAGGVAWEAPAGGGGYPGAYPIVNADVAAAAAIAYSKLNLTGAIVVADLAFDPATQAELNAHAATTGLSGHIPATGVTVAMLAFDPATQAELDAHAALTGLSYHVPATGIANAHVAAAAAIAYSKLNLAGAIQVADLAFNPATQAELDDHADNYGVGAHVPTGGITNGEVAAAAAIAYSKLNLTGTIVVADLAFNVATQAELDAATALLVPNSLVDAKGDLIGASANDTPVRIAVGANDGMVLEVDVAQAAGVKWSDQSIGQLTLARFFPIDTAAANLTPNALTATVARVFPFPVEGRLSLAQVVIKTPGAVVGGFQFGIFDSTGTRVWTSGAVTTTTGFTVITANLPVTLKPGQYYFAVTNNGSTSTTNALSVSAALTAANVPRWGTVAATAGAMPASIDPTAITETVGGFPIYTVLSAWTT